MSRALAEDRSQTADVHGLRSSLRLLEQLPGQLLRTETPVDPTAELAGVYRYVGAGGTVLRPTRTGPAMLFEDVKGYPGVRVVAGLLATRERTAHLVGSRPDRIGRDLLRAIQSPIEPVMLAPGAVAPCQEVVHRSPLDILQLIPAPTNTPQDAGPYFTLGVVRATDPETGEHDVTIHRLCVRSRDALDLLCAQPPHRRLPPEGRGRRQTAARVHFDRPRPGHLPDGQLRGADHASGLRRTLHRGRAARRARRAGPLRFPARIRHRERRVRK